jgi:hypothetical protein
VLKMVDWLIEEATHADGLDLYERGGHIALARLLFYTLHLGGDGFFKAVTGAFQAFMRQRSHQAWERFRQIAFRKHPVDVVEDCMKYIRLPMIRLPWEHYAALPANALELSLSLSLQCLYSWRRSGIAEMVVIYDESSYMARQKDVWDAILSPVAPPALNGRGSFAEAVQFPIGVKETRFQKSGASVGIQLADVLAGAICLWAKWLIAGRSVGDSYAKALDSRVAEKLGPSLAAFLWPIPEISAYEEDPRLTDRGEYVQRLLSPVFDKRAATR